MESQGSPPLFSELSQVDDSLPSTSQDAQWSAFIAMAKSKGLEWANSLMPEAADSGIVADVSLPAADASQEEGPSKPKRTRRATALLTTPLLKVRAEGHHLIAELEELGPAFQFMLIYWNKESENSSKTVRSSQTSFHLDTVEAGMKYCVKAQTYVTAIHRYSNFTSPVCITVPGSTDSALTIGLLSLFGFIVAIVVLPFLGWKAHQMLRYSCCPTVVMPETLAVTDSPQKLICPKSSPLEEYVDQCSVMVEVAASDELRHLYMQKTL